MAQTLFFIIIIFIIAGFIFDRWLDYLDSLYWSNELPDELKDIYDAGKYRKSQDYEKTRHKFGLFTSSLFFVLSLAFILFDGFAFVDNIARSYASNNILVALVFFGIIAFAADILSTPFQIYGQFVIEEKFGFNKTRWKTFVADKIKSWLLSAVIGGGLISLLIWIYDFSGQYFWLIAWGAVTAFMIFMTMFASTLIVPLFNKQTPLEEGELRDAIKAFADKAGFKLDNIFVIDGSKRSTKANAYFSGLGAKKRIVLYDTLIKDHTTEELVAVLAHEIGHYKMKHTLKGMIMSVVQTGIMLFVIGLFIGNPELSKALGVEIPGFHIGILAFGLLYSPLSVITGVLMNILSRKNEYEADRFAAENYNAKPLQDALKKLSVNNLSNLRPHPICVFINYSHPPLLQRLKALQKFVK